ncbi:hypothetical protein O4O00_09060 [Citrobacter sedlakii]|uniref:hypothetical protein n=2 Tax=Enterobacterales TaxID=91347 RepID=UPI0022B361B3|nr:hypothetical protein [Citrobacter sedlakii]MCZ4674531.1 hypothetical protein [Citrobacter sedlakii]MDR5004586.1 hypothetical protein [Citrobacter sedlakii]
MNSKKIGKESNANEENSNLFTSDISIMIKGKEYSELLLLIVLAIYSIICIWGVFFLDQDKYPTIYNILLGSGCFILLCWPVIVALIIVIRLRLKKIN